MERSREIESQRPPKERKKMEFVYGNYPSYYGYRIGKTLEEDPRVGFFRREWIESRDCLDIGCNQGHVTIALAVRFCCKSMVGVDIDPKLIHKARQNLKQECQAWSERKSSDAAGENAGDNIGETGSGNAKEENGADEKKDERDRDLANAEKNGDSIAEENEEDEDQKREVRVPDQSADGDFPDAGKEGAKLPDKSDVEDATKRDSGKVGIPKDEKAFAKQSVATKGELVKTHEEKEVESGTASDEKKSMKEGVLSGVELSKRVIFKTQNYIESRTSPGTYDTILCLSVSKWIHLNWGDDGLLEFFAKIFKELRPGGCMVLEPQPWESYSKKRKVSETAKKNFHKIVLRPDSFPCLLTEKIGFKSFEQISPEVPSDKTGFRRPLYAYYK